MSVSHLTAPATAMKTMMSEIGRNEMSSSELERVTTWSARKMHRAMVGADRTLCNEKATRPAQRSARHGYGVSAPTSLSQDEIEGYAPCKRCEKAAGRTIAGMQSIEGPGDRDG